MTISKETLEQIGRDIGDDAYIISLEEKIEMAKIQIEALGSKMLDMRDDHIKLLLAAKKYHEESGKCTWGYDLGETCPLCVLLTNE